MLGLEDELFMMCRIIEFIEERVCCDLMGKFTGVDAFHLEDLAATGHTDAHYRYVVYSLN